MMPKVNTTKVVESNQKRFRNGTRSCAQCRRRKTRCIFRLETPDICEECYLRGCRCINQEDAQMNDQPMEQKRNLKDRVTRLEHLMDSVVQERSGESSRTPTHASGGLQQWRLNTALPTPASSVDTPAFNLNDEGPIHSLVENDILRLNSTAGQALQRGPESNMPSSPKPCLHVHSKRAEARNNLIALLPPWSDLVVVLQDTCSWWHVWRQCFPNQSCDEVDLTLQQFVFQALDPRQENLAIVGTAVLCVARSVQVYLSLSRERPNTTPIHNITCNMDECLAAVEQSVTSDPDSLGTVESILCFLVQVSWYTDIGQLRRAWLTLQRAMSHAALAGLHRQHTSSKQRDSLWWHLFIADRFISLSLGLPYGIANNMCNLAFSDKLICDPAEAFGRRMSVFAGRVVERTQGYADHSYASALDLDQEIDAVASRTPHGWWYYAAPNILENNDALEGLNPLAALYSFYQVKIYLHLPFMLQSAINKRYEYSRAACLESARGMAQVYNKLRSTGLLAYLCRVVDFQGFTATILLLLGLLGYGRHLPPDLQQEAKDRQLVQTSMELLRQAPCNASVATGQGNRALDMLFMLASGQDCSMDPKVETKIQIPYFGTISVHPRKKSVSHVPSLASQLISCDGNDAEGSIPISHSAMSNLEKPFITYEGFYMPMSSGHVDEGVHPSAKAMDDEDLTWHFNMNDMDIDQDFSWILNDFP